MNSFKSLDVDSKVESNLEMFMDIGKTCSKDVLFFIIGNSRDCLIRKLI